MTALSRNWPIIRQIIYSVGTGALGALTLAGVITQDQSSTWLEYVVTGLGAVGFILAGLNVNRPAPAAAESEPAYVPEPFELPTLPAPIVLPDFDALAARATAEVDRLRADLEHQLGR